MLCSVVAVKESDTSSTTLPRLAGRRTDETDEEIKTEIEDATKLLEFLRPTLHADGFGEPFLGSNHTAADAFGNDIAFPRSGAVGFINDNKLWSLKKTRFKLDLAPDSNPSVRRHISQIAANRATRPDQTIGGRSLPISESPSRTQIFPNSLG